MSDVVEQLKLMAKDAHATKNVALAALLETLAHTIQTDCVDALAAHVQPWAVQYIAALKRELAKLN